MKQSWIIGTIMIWLGILFFELAATQGTSYGGAVQTSMNSLWTIDFTNFAGAISSIATLATNLGTYFVAFIQIVFLWSPTVFDPNTSFFWFWQFVCFPISVSFILVLITVARGVHSS